MGKLDGDSQSRENRSMAEPTIIIVELVGGVHDGTTLIAEDPSQDIRLDVWDESDRAIAIFRDTSGGEIGARFCTHSDQMHRTRPRYAHHQKANHQGNEYMLEIDSEQYTEHEYEVTDRLADDGQILIRAQHIDSSKTSTLIWGKARNRPK
ncbi:MAG: hypothetical protein ABIK89_21340 [Planctomycetota bacterium]